TVGPLELGAFGGYGLYAEKGCSGIERDAGGVLAGAMVSARLGSFTVALAFSDLPGEYDEDDVSAPFRFRVPRRSLGVGSCTAGPPHPCCRAHTLERAP